MTDLLKTYDIRAFLLNEFGHPEGAHPDAEKVLDLLLDVVEAARRVSNDPASHEDLHAALAALDSPEQHKKKKQNLSVPHDYTTVALHSQASEAGEG